MKILVLDNYDSFTYNLVHIIRELGYEMDVIRNNKIEVDAIKQYDKILLSPGPGIPEEAGELMKVIEQFHAEKPILGICLGHQAIGEYFGARLVQNEFPLHGKSTLINKVIDDKLFIGLPAKFEVGRYHSWSIENNSSVLEVTSQTDQNEVMSIKHASLPIYGLQFHPESIDTDHGMQLINNFLNI